MIDTIHERVQAGAKSLDTFNPGWETKINLDRLNVADPHRCVLGQLYGEYGDAPSGLRDNEIEWGFYAEVQFTAEEMNFETYVARRHLIVDQINAEYQDLTNTWRDLITCRREEAAKPVEQPKEASFDEIIDGFQQELNRITMDRVSHLLVTA